VVSRGEGALPQPQRATCKMLAGARHIRSFVVRRTGRSVSFLSRNAAFTLSGGDERSFRPGENIGRSSGEASALPERSRLPVLGGGMIEEVVNGLRSGAFRKRPWAL